VVKIIEGSGTTVPEAGGINQNAQVVGSIDVRGHTNFWLWSDGVRQDLPLGNGRSGLATAINNLGPVVGSFLTGEFYVDIWGDVNPVYHAFVWTDGSLQDLGTLGGWNSFGLWINDQGVVVGASSSDNHDGLPFIARDSQMRSLQSLISNPSGWKLALETHYVAADGRIWGLGTYGGKEHIYEMTPETNGDVPHPEPGSDRRIKRQDLRIQRVRSGHWKIGHLRSSGEALCGTNQERSSWVIFDGRRATLMP